MHYLQDCIFTNVFETKILWFYIKLSNYVPEDWEVLTHTFYHNIMSCVIFIVWLVKDSFHNWYFFQQLLGIDFVQEQPVKNESILKPLGDAIRL